MTVLCASVGPGIRPFDLPTVNGGAAALRFPDFSTVSRKLANRRDCARAAYLVGKETCQTASLWMIRLRAEICIEQLFPGWLVPSRGWFDGHKHGVNRTEELGIIHAEHPSLLRTIVDVEHAQIPCHRTGPFALSPSLEANFGAWAFLREVKGIEE